MRLKFWEGWGEDYICEIEHWDARIELLSVKWNEFLNLARKREVTLASMGETKVAVVTKGESGSVSEKGRVYSA